MTFAWFLAFMSCSWRKILFLSFSSTSSFYDLISFLCSSLMSPRNNVCFLIWPNFDSRVSIFFILIFMNFWSFVSALIIFISFWMTRYVLCILSWILYPYIRSITQTSSPCTLLLLQSHLLVTTLLHTSYLPWFTVVFSWKFLNVTVFHIDIKIQVFFGVFDSSLVKRVVESFITRALLSW